MRNRPVPDRSLVLEFSDIVALCSSRFARLPESYTLVSASFLSKSASSPFRSCASYLATAKEQELRTSGLLFIALTPVSEIQRKHIVSRSLALFPLLTLKHNDKWRTAEYRVNVCFVMSATKNGPGIRAD